jgi:hypothetical protein
MVSQDEVGPAVAVDVGATVERPADGVRNWELGAGVGVGDREPAVAQCIDVAIHGRADAEDDVPVPGERAAQRQVVAAVAIEVP